jgi:hypothetical protein
MRGQTHFGWRAGLFAALTICLVFSGCLDAIKDIEGDFPEVPSNNSENQPETPSSSVTAHEGKELEAALANPEVTSITIAPGTSLVINGATVSGREGSMTIPSSSQVTIHGLSVPAGSILNFYKERVGDPDGQTGETTGQESVSSGNRQVSGTEGSGQPQIALDSLEIAGRLSVNDDIRVTLGGVNQVTGELSLALGTLIIDSGAQIAGSEAGRIDIGEAVKVLFINGDSGDENNFFDQINGNNRIKPAGSFFWKNDRWEKSGEYLAGTLDDFFKASLSVTYLAADSKETTKETFEAARTGVKTLALPSGISVTIDSLHVKENARLKLEGTGTLTAKKIVLENGAELEVGTGATFKVDDGYGNELRSGSKIIVRGTLDNKLENWTIAGDIRATTLSEKAGFVFLAGSSVKPGKGSPASVNFIGTGTDANITLGTGMILLHTKELRLEGDAVLNQDFALSTWSWTGKIYIRGNLKLKKQLSVKDASSVEKPYFELADNATVTVESGGDLSIGPGNSQEIYGKLGQNSKIVVESGGIFHNYIFPNWAHEGTGDQQGAFIFKAGSSGSVSPFSDQNSTLSIGKAGSAVALTQGQIRLTAKTLILEKGTAMGGGEATLNKTLTLPDGLKLALNDSGLIIAKGATFSADTDTSGKEFITLTNAGIVVESGGVLTIAKTEISADVKLASLAQKSSIEVRGGGKFINGIYPNWTMDANSEFIFHANSVIKISEDDDKGVVISTADGNANLAPPVNLLTGTIYYGNKKITLKSGSSVTVADASQVSALWSGFKIILEIGSKLTVGSTSQEGPLQILFDDLLKAASVEENKG